MRCTRLSSDKVLNASVTIQVTPFLIRVLKCALSPPCAHNVVFPRRIDADGVVCMDALVLVLNSTASPASGCTDRTATNFAPEASVDDGSCEWMGGRGALLQSWRTYAAKVSRVISDADSAVVMRFWRLGMLGSQRLAKKRA